MGLLLRPKFQASPVENEALYLFKGAENHILEGGVFADLAPVLDGRHSEEAIADLLEDRHGRATVHYALGILRDHQLIIEQTGPADSQDAFWDALDFAPAEARERLRHLKLVVTAMGDVHGGELVAALADDGIAVRTGAEPEAGEVQIVLTDDYLSDAIAELARRNWSAKRPWVIASNVGAQLWIGPFFPGGGAGCFECLLTRLRTNRVIETYARARAPSGAHRSAPPQTGLSRALAGHLIAMEVVKYWAGGGPELLRTTVIDLGNLDVSRHPLEARPQCPVCGNVLMQSELLSRPLELVEDESVPRRTVDELMRYVSPITGVVSALAPVGTEGSVRHYYTAHFGFAGGARSLAELKNHLMSQASGVGITADEARTGAMCEAVERYSGTYQGDEPSVTAALSSLPADLAIHPNDIMLFSPRQYADRDTINARGEPFDLVPDLFDSDQDIEWTGLWSLTSRRFKLLPTALLYYHYPQSAEVASCWAESNGCAAGSTLADAVRRGLLEVIERDSVAIWWYNRLSMPAVDLRSFGSPYFDALLAEYAALEREVWVLDLTADIPVPSFVALSRCLDGPEDIVFGFGAHPDARTAIQHALCEMNHLLPAVLPENRLPSGDYPYPDAAHKRWWRTSSLASCPYLAPVPDRRPRFASDYEVPAGRSDAAEASAIRALLEARGLEVLVLNQTRPDIGLPVAKVVVPGMRHFWARFAPGRLFDVPVLLGWRPGPTPERDLNPVSMFV